MTDDTRREVALGDISALSAAVADEGREPGVGDTGMAAGPRQVRRIAAATPATPATWHGHPRSVLVLGALVVLLLGTVIFLVVQQRQLAASLAALEQRARESVASLETQVASTSTTLRSADSETQKSLNLVAKDIARLDANIARLSTRLDQEGKARAAVDAELKAAAGDLRKLSQSVAQSDSQLDGRLRTLADGVEQLSARQKTQADSLARLERSGELAQLRSEVAVLGASLREMQDEHEKRLKAAEQAVGSSDAFRRQVNSTIDRLNQQVAELYQRR